MDFDGAGRVRTGLKGIVEKYRLEVRLTPQQNVYLVGIREQDRATIAALLRVTASRNRKPCRPFSARRFPARHHPPVGKPSQNPNALCRKWSPRSRMKLNAVGLTEDVVHLRTSACPNGCSRPCSAAIGIVGASVDMYSLYLVASSFGTRMGTCSPRT